MHHLYAGQYAWADVYAILLLLKFSPRPASAIERNTHLTAETTGGIIAKLRADRCLIEQPHSLLAITARGTLFMMNLEEGVDPLTSNDDSTVSTTFAKPLTYDD